MNPTVRKIVLVIIAIVFTYFAFQLIKSKAPEKLESTKEQPLKRVRAIPAFLTTHYAKVGINGKIKAFEKVALYSEVNGMLLTSNFKVGNSYKKGQVLLALDNKEFSYSLQAQKSNFLSKISSMMGDLTIDFPEDAQKWDTYLSSIDPQKPIEQLPEVENVKLKRYLAGRDIFNQYYQIKANEEKLQKYIIRAPFTGELSDGMLSKGELIRPGQKLGEFVNSSSYELESEISISDLQYLKKGISVKLTSEQIVDTFDAEIDRFNAVLDPNSQMVKVYLKVKGEQLKEGLFLSGSIDGLAIQNAMLIDRKLIKEEGVYLVKSNTIEHKKVTIKSTTQSYAIIQGLKKTDTLLADNVKGVFHGMKVKVVND